MTEPRSLYLDILGHEMHVTEWGAAEAPPVVMWHGLARTGRDFDTAARHLAGRFRVICPDTVGRGLSGWSSQPDSDYTVAAYCRHAAALLDALGVEQCRWVGTSMGGIIGMAMAGTADFAARIGRLVVNDAGPRLNQAAIDRIKSYAGVVPDLASVTELEKLLRFVYAPFGALTDAEWRQMAETSMRRLPNGRVSTHMDPAVMRVFAEQYEHFDMWPVYDAITCPVLVLRGAVSDLLDAEVAEEMTARGPRARLVTVPGCGHAPYLNTPEQIALLEGFLG